MDPLSLWFWCPFADIVHWRRAFGAFVARLRRDVGAFGARLRREFGASPEGRRIC